MKPVSDLLREVSTDAPPPRLDVDDVVAAGRRRQRHRAGGWAIAGATAVAVAIGVPQIVIHADGPPPAIRPAVPSVAPSAPGTFTFAFPFRGYGAGEYRVADPNYMRISGTTAEVRRGSERVGSLRVFEPGVVPEVLHDGTQRVEVAPLIGLADGSFLRKKDRPDLLTWKYAADAVAVLVPDTGQVIPAADMRRIAESFTTAVPRAAVVPFRLGYLPGDLRLLTVISQPGPEAFAAVQLIPDAMARDVLGRPGRDVPPGRVPVMVTVSLVPPQPDDAAGHPPRELTCDPEDEGTCVIAVGDDGYRISVHGQGVSLAAVRKILAGVAPAADPRDAGTWTAANDAVPAFAQLPAR